MQCFLINIKKKYVGSHLYGDGRIYLPLVSSYEAPTYPRRRSQFHVLLNHPVKTKKLLYNFYV